MLVNKDKRTIQLGIVGCGKGAGTMHLPALRHVDTIRVIGASDRNESCLQTVADRFSIPKRFIDYRELLAQKDIDAIAIFTPPDSHREIGLAAMESGKHLFIDKPLAVNVNDCEALVQKASQSPVIAMLGFNFRWHRLLRRSREFIRSGRLGEVKALQSTYTHWHPGETAQVWHGKREQGGGVLLNDGVHHFDLWRFLLGREVAEVFSVSSSSEFYEDETSAVTAWMDGNIIASGVFSFTSSPESVIEVYGSLGTLVVSCYCFDGFEFLSNQTYPGSVTVRIRKIVNTLKELPESVPAILRGGDFLYAYRNQWRHFADCVMTGKEPECTFEDGKKAVEIARAAVESVVSGEKVKVGSSENVKGDGGNRE